MRSLFLALILFLLPSFAVAEEVLSAQLDARLAALSQDLTPAQAQHFWSLYTSANITQSVRVVQGDTRRAVEACSAEHSPMKTDLLNRFLEWEEAVGPALTEAQGQVQNMITVQGYADAQDLKALLTLAEQTRAQTQGAQSKSKEIVTTQSACERLLSTMNDTQTQMVALLRSTLRSIPAQAGEEL